VYRHSIEAWQSVGSPETLSGAPDWRAKRVHAAFRAAVSHRPWWPWLDETDAKGQKKRGNLLHCIRAIGADLDEFLGWFRALDDTVQEQVGHPRTLWSKFEQQRTARKGDREQPRRADEAHEERQENATRMDELDREIRTMHEALDIPVPAEDALRIMEELASRQETITGRDFLDAVVAKTRGDGGDV
jgi:hypothetical protein